MAEHKKNSLQAALQEEAAALKEEAMTLHQEVASLERKLESTEKQRRDVLVRLADSMKGHFLHIFLFSVNSRKQLFTVESWFWVVLYRFSRNLRIYRVCKCRPSSPHFPLPSTHHSLLPRLLVHVAELAGLSPWVRKDSPERRDC